MVHGMSSIKEKIRKISQDILKIIHYKKIEKEYKRIFFCENNYIYNYIKNYINNENTIIVSFNKIDVDSKNYYFFNTNFFLELFFYIIRIKFFYTSTPGIGYNICKKSFFKNTKYIYLQHSPVGLINAYDENAFKNFDVVNCINEFQTQDIKKINRELKKKIKIFKSKCNYLKNIYINTSINYDVLIAPTWNTNFYNDEFLFKLVNKLIKNNISYVFRPHPMSVKKKEFNLNLIKEKNLKLDESSNLNLYPYKNLITDWSGIMFEFFYLKEKRPLIIETSEKKNNKAKIFLENESFEKQMRPKISIMFKKEEIDNLVNYIKIPQKINVDKLKNEIFY